MSVTHQLVSCYGDMESAASPHAPPQKCRLSASDMNRPHMNEPNMTFLWCQSAYLKLLVHCKYVQTHNRQYLWVLTEVNFNLTRITWNFIHKHNDAGKIPPSNATILCIIFTFFNFVCTCTKHTITEMFCFLLFSFILYFFKQDRSFFNKNISFFILIMLFHNWKKKRD